MKQIALIVLSLFCIQSFAQKRDKKLIEISEVIRTDDLKKHLYYIAGEETEGRDTPSPGLDKAADYIINEYKKNGLTPTSNGTYKYMYSLYKDSLLNSTFKINDRVVSTLSVEMNYLTIKQGFSEAIFIGDGSFPNYKETEARARIVIMMNKSFSKGDKGQWKLSAISPRAYQNNLFDAMEKGPSIIVSVIADEAKAPMRSNWRLKKYRSTNNPAIIYINESAFYQCFPKDSIDKYLQSFSKNDSDNVKELNANFELEGAKVIVERKVPNTMAIVEGTDKKDEWVVISAHMDHLGKRDNVIYYGADDDGSGTVGVIALAKAFAEAKKKGKGPRRNILLTTVSGEEKGLWGSEAYTDNPLYDLAKTSIDINIDMIGRTATEYMTQKDSINYIFSIGDDKLSTEIAPILDDVNKRYINLYLDRKYNDPKDENRFYYRSDHYNYALKGVPIVFFFDGLHPDYHQPTDTPEKINYELLAKRVKLAFFLAMEVANRDKLLKRDKPL
jgi:hypothetical protein